MTQIQEIIPGTKMTPPYFNSHLSHLDQLPFTTQLSTMKLRDGDHHFEILLSFPLWGTGNVSLSPGPIVLTLETAHFQSGVCVCVCVCVCVM
jgi:hypothetical protein